MAQVRAVTARARAALHSLSFRRGGFLEEMLGQLGHHPNTHDGRSLFADDRRTEDAFLRGEIFFHLAFETELFTMRSSPFSALQR